MVALADTPRIEGSRAYLGRRAVLALTGLAAVVALMSLGHGASGVSALRTLWAMVSGGAVDATDAIVITQIRLPRMVAGLAVGASLAVAGTLMQGLFRNPLADPGLLGVSAGASLGAISAIVLGGALPVAVQGLMGWHLVPVAAFAGGWVAMLTLYAIATRAGRTSVATMLLAGLALAAMISALSGLVVYRANDDQLRDLTFWGMGSLAGASWTRLGACLPIMALAAVVAATLPRGLNALALGEAVALHLGTDVQRIKRRAILSAAALAGASVAMAGGIGFVGIVAPHLLRLVIGPDHRYLLPAAGALGGAMLVAADMVSRSIVAPAELPIGILTAVIGGPFFLWILLSNRRVIDL
ncbi:FecCD family ABC transporter permease [Paracoccus pacificus]|uniref:FecCD family ABC transporter permease n=1 Tax=Paracoccus pacificus TaxID=1463598 RepID=A0ABW4R4S6_9RHOB